MNNNAQSSIFTGFGSVEVVYVPEAGQAFCTNYESKTLTIAALPENATGFFPGQFVNIVFDENPATLHVRRTDKGTDVFVSIKYWGEDNNTKAGLLQRVRIAPTVEGIDGITELGACTVTVFNMINHSVTAPKACNILDSKQSYKALLNIADMFAADLKQSYFKIQGELDISKALELKIKSEKHSAEKLQEQADPAAIPL